MTNLETLEQQFIDLGAKLKQAQEELGRLKNGWEMKCPYEKGDEYWALDSHGNLLLMQWDGYDFEEQRLNQGNTFPTKQAAELESKRRNLLTRFRAFRDECNRDWKADFGEKCKTSKYLIGYSWDYIDEQYKLKSLELGSSDLFHQFGYFKNRKDAERAIKLFGDEIKELFVDCE